MFKKLKRKTASNKKFKKLHWIIFIFAYGKTW